MSDRICAYCGEVRAEVLVAGVEPACRKCVSQLVCASCSGTGESRAGGWICHACRGTGEAQWEEMPS